MEYWEFLLQKEGDRSWLPIKLPRIEIEEGRYRVVAHSSRSNTDVEVNVTHDSTEEVPPRRRSQKRSRRTNQEGLMVVIPFTYLKKGLWQLRCSGDILSDFLCNSWQHAVQIQVLSKVTDIKLTDKPISPVADATQTPVEVKLSENLASSSNSYRAVETEPLKIETPALTPQTAHSIPEPAVEAEPLKINAPALTPQTAHSVPEPAVEAEPLKIETPALASQTAHSIPEPAVEAEPLKIETPALTPQTAHSIPEPAVEAEPLKIETPALTPQTAHSVPEPAVEAEPLKINAPDLPVPVVEAAVEEPEIQLKSETNVYEAESVPATLEDTVVNPEPPELEENNTELNSISAEEASSTNPILDQSLQMLEQILQQVLEPVLQDFERSESPEPEIKAESEQSLEIDINQQGLTLTLNEDGLVARRGESFTIAGNVDVLDAHQLKGTRTSSDANSIFQGTLRYELRDPQSLRVLLDIQQPLSEQLLPLVFSHTLDIPPDCNTRLILGKVTLYNSTSVALASQPFSVTADLDELLEAIIPGTQVMPVAKMLVLANNPTTFQDNEVESSESASQALDPALLDLINAPESRQPAPLKRAPSQPLPPKIYQTSPTQRSSKSLQLPDFPRLQPFATSAESSAALSTPDGVEVKPEDSEMRSKPFVLADDLSLAASHPLPAATAENMALEFQLQEMERQLEEAIAEGDSLPVTDSSSSALDAIQLSDDLVQIAESPPVTSNTPETPAPLKSTPASKLDTVPNGHDPSVASSRQDSSWEATELTRSEATDELDTVTATTDFQSTDSDSAHLWDTPELEISSAEVSDAEPVVDENAPADVDNAFQALKIQDRFWLRLNSLAADVGLSQWLKSDGSPSSKPADVEKVTQQSNPEQLLVDFDESMWEEDGEDFDRAIAPPAELESPLLMMSTDSEEDLSDEPPLLDVAKIDWTAQEIVVEDEEDLPSPEQREVRKEASSRVYQAVPLGSQPEPKILSPRQLELPLPAPTLFIPTSELASGETVTVRVKLPPHPARLCIKLWVQDRQSRSLLDGPRWLVDLIPDGAGLLEAMTQLTVPFGSVEIRFEAIAVDLDSQRESHKVAVDCVVLPPDMLNLPLDEFET